MQIELSNGLNHVWQWDPKITITVVAPEDAQSVHFRWGGRAVEFPLDNHTVNIPPELMQQPRQIRIWAYKPDHTLDVADIPVYPKTKPADYAYTPTEIRTWEQLDERIKALEQGGGVAGVTSVNGKSGTVELTAKDVGATTVEDVIGAMETAVDRCQPKGDYITQDKLQSATDAALKQAKESGEFDGDTGPQGPKGDTGDTGPQGPQGEPGTDAVEDISLGLTSATVGQTIKVKAVDKSGVPTEWEAADIQGGGERAWVLLADVNLTEDSTAIAITKTPSGETFSVNELIIFGEPVGDGTHRDLSFFLYKEIAAQGTPRITVWNVLSASDGATSYLATHIQVFPKAIFARTQYSLYNIGIGTTNNNSIFNSTDMRTDANEGQVAYAMIGNPVTKLTLGAWSSGTSGVLRAGTKFKVYGR